MVERGARTGPTVRHAIASERAETLDMTDPFVSSNDHAGRLAFRFWRDLGGGKGSLVGAANAFEIDS
jgi:hypothetical protein